MTNREQPRPRASKNPTGIEDLFVLPYRGRYLIYMPLAGVLLTGNAALVRLLSNALQGDRGAMTQLGMDGDILRALRSAEEQRAGLLAARPAAPFAPTEISLFLTTNCTQRCRYCYANGGDRPREMPWGIAAGAIDEVFEHAVGTPEKRAVVHFHGGGDVSAAWPLLERTVDYLYAKAAASQIQLQVSIGLNGMLGPEQRQWVIQHIQEATVSLDGPPDVHNAQRPCANGGPSFDVVDGTLLAFDAAGFNYAVRGTVTAESVTRLAGIVDFICRRYSAPVIQMEPVCSQGRAVALSVQPPAADDFVRGFRAARAIARAHGRKLVFSGAESEMLRGSFCKAASGSCGITPDGWITACYEVLDPSDPLADQFFYGRYDTERRRMVIDEARRRSLRAISARALESCRSCFCRWHCAGDCLVKSSRGEADTQAARCRINRALTMDQLVEAVEGDRG